MRKGGVVAAVVLSLALSAPAAHAQAGPGPTVVATSDNEFFPKTLTRAPSTTVYFENRGLNHNVKFEDGQFEQPGDPTPTPWRSAAPLRQPRHLRLLLRGARRPGGVGMSGTVVIEQSPGPVLSGLGARPSGSGRRTRRCRPTRAKIAFELSEPARVTGGIDPVGKPAGRPSTDIEIDGKPGKNTIPVAGHGLRAGVYAVTSGPRTPTATRATRPPCGAGSSAPGADRAEGRSCSPTARLESFTWPIGAWRIDTRRARPRGGDDPAQRARLPPARPDPEARAARPQGLLRARAPGPAAADPRPARARLQPQSIRHLIERDPGDSLADAIEFTRSLLAAPADEPPHVVSSQVFLERWGDQLTPELARAHGEARLRPARRRRRLGGPSPRLERASIALSELGIPLEDALEIAAVLKRSSRSVARAYADLFVERVWQPFEDAGEPAEDWPRVREALDRLRPLAGESLVAVFEIVMARRSSASSRRSPTATPPDELSES